ncbi:MAG: DNA-directed RNA polymerase subunit alpha C-terminal domain-containing protein [Chloroflexota bacterium]
MTELEQREAARTSPERPIADLEDVNKRIVETLADAGITTVGEVLEKLTTGEQTLLDIRGFGRKSLADLKKALRRSGYELLEVTEEIVV